MKTRFAEKMNANLPIYGIDKGNLKDFTTTEKDFKKGQNRYPPSQFRIKSEDLLREADNGGKNNDAEEPMTQLENF